MEGREARGMEAGREEARKEGRGGVREAGNTQFVAIYQNIRSKTTLKKKKRRKSLMAVMQKQICPLWRSKLFFSKK